MSNRFSCALNGVSAESVDASICVTDLTELPPRRRVSSVPMPGHGLRILKRVRESLTVRVSFVIREYDPVLRRDAARRLHAWADSGGWLTVSDRPGLRLQVVCETLPALSALCWTDELQLDFTAFGIPFWELEEETEASTDSTASLLLPGDADECPVDADVVNQGSGTLTTVSLQCGRTRMTFDGLSLLPGEALLVKCSGDVFCAEAAGASVLMHRTGDSSDMLLADGGVEMAVSVTADQPVSARFHARGRML